jgi:hypothetical protein
MRWKQAAMPFPVKVVAGEAGPLRAGRALLIARSTPNI